MTEGFQIDTGVGQGQLGIASRPQDSRHFGQALETELKIIGESGKTFVRPRFADGFRHAT